jgi:hypothetical protein
MLAEKKKGAVARRPLEKRGTMSKSNYTGEGSKSRPKLVYLPTKPPARLRLGGMEPSDDMQPGQYKISCEGASKKSFAEGFRIELRYRVIDGPHTGTDLRQWITIDATGVISPKSRYALQCAVALGRPLDASDNPDDPASIFSGLIFRAFVGFRKTEKARGGKATPENAEHRKDSADGLRVHDLLAREEL